jgi:hypothetical protein
MLTRRNFVWSSTAFGVTSVMVSCPMSNVYESINKYIPVALLAFDRVLQVLGQAGIDTAPLLNASNSVKAAFGDIQTAILQFHDAVQDQKNTLISLIYISLDVAISRIEDFFDLLHLGNQQVAATIKALLSIIVSTIEGFKQQLPPRPGPIGPARSLNPLPQLRNIEQFKADYNAVLDKAGDSQFDLR